MPVVSQGQGSQGECESRSIDKKSEGQDPTSGVQDPDYNPGSTICCLCDQASVFLSMK